MQLQMNVISCERYHVQASRTVYYFEYLWYTRCNRVINGLLSVIECPFNGDALRKNEKQRDRSPSDTRPTNNWGLHLHSVHHTIR